MNFDKEIYTNLPYYNGSLEQMPLRRHLLYQTRNNQAGTRARLQQRKTLAKRQRYAVYARNRRFIGGGAAIMAARMGGRVERKYTDSTSVESALTTTGVFWCLNGTQPGTDPWERVGRQITVRSLDLKIKFQPLVAMANPMLARVIILWDSQTNGALPNIDAVLANDVPGLTHTMRPKNMDNRDRFIVLRDRKIMVNPMNQTGVGNIIQEFVPINKETQYNAGVAGTVADIATGSLIMIILAEANLMMHANVQGRVIFFDK